MLSHSPTSHHLRRLGAGAGLLCCALLLLVWMELPLKELWAAEGWKYALACFRGLLQPSLDGGFVLRVLRLLLESLAIGALGMVGALLLGVPLALMAARLPTLPDPPGARHLWQRVLAWCVAGLRGLARGALVFLRAIPTLVWAFLFVRIFGLGPAPAVFAIALSFAGIIGKLYAELAEAVKPGPVRGLQAAGVGWWGVLLWGVLPQVRGQWVGYAWFRFECALRRAAILGIVGAGGIGAEIALSLRYFQFDRLATSLLAVLATIALFELLSRWLRKRDWRWSAAALLCGGCVGGVWLSLPWSSLWAPSSLVQLKQFLVGFGAPETGAAWLGKAALLMGQTLGMAWLATLAAALVAWLLSPLACGVLWGSGALLDPPGRRSVGVWLGFLVRALVRLCFQLSRALPSLVWALLFVLWVGPGPLAGVLAIACHTVGVLGRLFGEVYEDTPLAAVQSLEAAGASGLGRWLYGLMPSAAPRLLAFASFRFEVNVRATAVLGFVGAGGIGDAIHTALSLFHFRKLASLLLVLLFCVVLVDTLGHLLRHRLLRAPSFS